MTARRRGLVLAVVALMAISACGQVSVPEATDLDGLETTAPAATPAATVKPAPTKVERRIWLDFDELGRRQSSVPYWSAERGSIVDDSFDTSVPYPEPPAELIALDSGEKPSYAAIGLGDAGSVQLIDSDGGTRDVGRGYGDPEDLVASPYRRNFAWRGLTSKGDARVLVAETRSGRVIVDDDIGPDESVGWASFLFVLLAEERAAPGELAVIWLTDGRRYRADDPLVRTRASDALVPAATDSTERDSGECTGVYRLGDWRQPVWESCDLVPVSIHPRGRYAVVRGLLDRNVYTLVDLTNGRRLLQIRGAILGKVTWSTNGQEFVLEVNHLGKSALVTCDLTGRCGLSTDPVPYEPWRTTRRDAVPYVLAR